MKKAKKLLHFLINIGNFFLGAFVTFNVYQWFSPEVGFDLPVLNYLNILALNLITTIFIQPLGRILQLNEIYKFLKAEAKDKRDYEFIGNKSYNVTLALLFIWGFNYLIYIALF